MSPTVSDALKELGQLFIIGFSGLELTEETCAFYREAGIGGVILFSPNYENPGQLAELINQAQECRGELPLWVSADYEGGRVQRFKRGFTKIPEAASIAAMDSPKLTFEIAEVMARELRAVGVNVNFAPVADINTNPRNPVIGPRAFGTNEEVVAKHSSAVVRGHLVHGVQPCVKHFPGHGDTTTDSHFALPKVDTPLEVLRERELRPFAKAFKARCAMVMTAHIVLPHLDPDRPATLSPRILRNLLRTELRFGGVIVSDDMEMKAVVDHFGADAPRLAIEAGCDLLTYRSEAAGRAAYVGLCQALEAGRLDPALVLAAAARTRALKRESLLPYHPVPVADVGRQLATPESLAIVEKVSSPTGR